MGDSGIDSPLASEFVKFLNAQLKECREEVQRLAQVSSAKSPRVVVGCSRAGLCIVLVYLWYRLCYHKLTQGPMLTYVCLMMGVFSIDSITLLCKLN